MQKPKIYLNKLKEVVKLKTYLSNFWTTLPWVQFKLIVQIIHKNIEWHMLYITYFPKVESLYTVITKNNIKLVSSFPICKTFNTISKRLVMQPNVF